MRGKEVERGCKSRQEASPHMRLKTGEPKPYRHSGPREPTEISLDMGSCAQSALLLPCFIHSYHIFLADTCRHSHVRPRTPHRAYAHIVCIASHPLLMTFHFCLMHCRIVCFVTNPEIPSPLTWT